MCLVLLDPEIKIAKGDIICYKVMVKRGETLISPYKGMRYECGTTYVSETPMRVKYGLLAVHLGNHLKQIDAAHIEEGFHSLVIEKEAVSLKSALQRQGPQYVVVKCLIPSGTRYAVGVFYSFRRSFSSFCSERIIAVEEE